MTHKYADMLHREVLGLSMNKAIEDARAFADKIGKETLVYFKRWDEGARRYDWCTARVAQRDMFPDGDRIVWSSEEGYYESC